MAHELVEQTKKMYVEYGRYINKFRSFPLIYDGLKLVERRILISLSIEAKNNFTKSARVCGHCMGNLHPHSDAYGTLVLLANNGLVDQQGNFGTSIGIHEEPAAASRYTEVRMNKEVYEESFELLKYVKEEDLEMNPEPIYLPTSLPFCLRTPIYCQGIGFGFRTYIPSYSKEDLIKRLDWLLHDKTGDGPIIKPLTDCTFGSSNEDFKQLLTSGRGSIIYKGKLQLDKVNKCVYVRSIPPNKKFKSIINGFKEEITVQKSIGFLDESNGETGTKVKFMLTKRGQNLDKLYKKLQQKTTGSVTFECNMCDLEGNVICMSIDKMLLTTYEMYKNVNKVKIEDTIKKIESEITELEYMQKIKKALPELLKKYPDDFDKLVEELQVKTSIGIEIIKKLLDKYTISKILKIKIDIESKIQELNVEKDNLQHLDDYVWRKYQ